LYFASSMNRTENNLYASVIIPLALPATYTWMIPAGLQGTVLPGSRVEVQLRNKKYAGIVSRITDQKPAAFEPKAIGNLLDDEPVVHATQLQFWSWIAQYYMCTEGEVMQAAVPANLKLSSESILSWNEDYGTDFTGLGNDEYVIAEALEMKKELRMSEVQQLLQGHQVYPVVKRLLDKKVCYVWEELREKYSQKKETFVELNETYRDEDQLADLLNNWSRAPKQMELLLAYLHLQKTEGEVTQTALLKKSGASAAQLKALADKNILRLEKRAVNLLAGKTDASIDFELSPAQSTALQEIGKSFVEKNVCLLHGITASGKTLIYVHLIDQYIQQGKQVLYLLPEIALTTQIVRRLQKHFGSRIAIYHSKFNANERVDTWNRVKSGEVSVVLGARSSVFLPFSDLGLVIIDEEHDSSFKQQDPAPRYHARDAAIYYASLFQARVLLGSATPSVETYYNCEQGKYGLVTISERYGLGELPSIELVNIKPAAGKGGVRPAFTPPLIESIQSSIDNGKQVILFQNRRGYSPYMICNTCGWIPHCEHCDVTLTYHKARNRLSCHYCGTTYPVVQTCPACGSHQFVQKNFGTEKIEELLLEQFPQARIARMDHDSVRGKNAHDTLIRQFEDQRIDILVGTQMVVKGLDFEHVNLVGIIDADGILNFTDFRVNERAFQLM